MTLPLSKTQFLESEEGVLLRAELMKMVKSPLYNTRPVYSTFTSSKFQFVNKHMEYMSRHLGMDHWQYVSNVKLMTKIRKRHG